MRRVRQDKPGRRDEPGAGSARYVRSRLAYGLIALGAMAVAIASRSGRGRLPDFLFAYAGDTLWAVAGFLWVGVLARSLATWKTAGITAAIALAVELSQLYHAPWIDAIRATRLGGLAIGYGFLWSDLACYGVGIALASLGEAPARSLILARRGKLRPARAPRRP